MIEITPAQSVVDIPEFKKPKTTVRESICREEERERTARISTTAIRVTTLPKSPLFAHIVGRVPCATFTIFRVSRTTHRQNLAQSTDFVLILRTTSATEYLSLVCDTASSETSLCFLSKTQMSSEGSIANKGHPQKSLVEGVEQISKKLVTNIGAHQSIPRLNLGRDG
jgi:hypothetical protein